MTTQTPELPNFENYEFCRLALKELGYTGCLLQAKPTYEFLRSYLMARAYITHCEEFNKLWNVCKPTTLPVKYLPFLRWQLGMIKAANMFVKVLSVSEKFPSCEM